MPPCIRGLPPRAPGGHVPQRFTCPRARLSSEAAKLHARVCRVLPYFLKTVPSVCHMLDPPSGCTGEALTALCVLVWPGDHHRPTGQIITLAQPESHKSPRVPPLPPALPRHVWSPQAGKGIIPGDRRSAGPRWPIERVFWPRPPPTWGRRRERLAFLLCCALSISLCARYHGAASPPNTPVTSPPSLSSTPKPRALRVPSSRRLPSPLRGP